MLGVFLDTEANGLNPYRHKILEIAYQIVDLLTGEVKASFDSVVKISKEEWEKSDPESLAVNGFTYEAVEKGRDPSDIAREILDSFAKLGIRRGGAVFICQNPSFDRIFFSQIIPSDEQEGLHFPYHWLDLASMYWAKSMERGKKNPDLFPWHTGFSKNKIAKAYNLPEEHHPHKALNGVKHLILCYDAVIGFPGPVELQH